MSGHHLQVTIRCQPSEEEKAWKVQSNSIELPRDEKSADETPLVSFDFDGVFTEDFSHAQFYEKTIAPSVKRLINRESSCIAILTYGLPCTGKSHTVFGTSGQTRVKPDARGVITRCGEQLFSELSKSPNTSSRVAASFLHVFESEDGKNSRVADLFDMKKRDLEIIEESSTLQYSIPTLTEQSVNCPQDILSLVEKGYLMRNATGCVKDMIRKPAVKFGAAPSQPLKQYRPHSSNAVFTLTCERLQDGEDDVTVSRIIVADLAGRAIEEIHSDRPCSDTGIKVLHDILKILADKGSPETATALYRQSSLTKLLKPCLGSNYDTIVIGAVCLKGSAVNLTRRCLEMLSQARKINSVPPRVLKISLQQTALGRCLEEGERGRKEIAKKLGTDTAVEKVEQIGDREVKIDGSLYEDATASLLNLAKQVVSTESQIVRNGESLQKPVNSSAFPRQGMAQPLAMVRPLYPATHTTTSSISAKPNQQPSVIKSMLPSPLVKSTVAWKPPDKEAAATTVDEPSTPTLASKLNVDDVSSVSSSSLEGSDSEVDEKVHTTPVITGPPPPPLRGIPHLNPDAIDIGDSKPQQPKPDGNIMATPITSVVPSPHSQPVSPILLASDGLGGSGGIHHPNLHSVPLMTTSQASKFSGTVISPVTSIHHGEIQSGTVPLAPLPRSLHQRTNFNLQLNLAMDEGISPSGSSSTVSTEQLPHLSRDPLLVSPVSPVAKSLPSSPVAKTQVAVVSSISPPAAAAPIKVARKPPIPPTRAQQGDLNKVSTIREGMSSESSSDESLNSDSELADLQDEARDRFDPTMQQRTFQRLKPIQHTLLPLHLVSVQNDGVAGHHLNRPVLPSISPSPGDNNALAVLPPITSSPTQIPSENPPAYRETSSSHSLTSSGLPPNYDMVESRRESAVLHRQESFHPPDLTQYMSDEEIHMAAMEGVSSSQLKSLALQYGVDFRDHGGRTPLMYTIIGNQPKMCSLLIKLKAAVNAQDSSGMSPLLWATYLVKPDIIKILLRNGADIHHCDPAGRSAFHWAMKTPDIQCLRWLCKYINSPVIVNQPDNEGLTPLHWAVMADQPAHIKLFLTSSNADIGVQDRDGRAALNFAVLNFSPSCIRAILDCYESAINLIDGKGRTALHYACAEGSADCVRTLLSYRSCDIHCADNKGTTPLHWAAAANQPGLVQLLLRRGADRTIRDYEEMLPINYAEQSGHTECVKLLKSYGQRRPLSAVSHVALPPPTAAPTLDEHGHVQLKNPTRRFSLSGESLTSFDRRLPADGQAQPEGNTWKEEEGHPQEQSPVGHEVEQRGEGEGEHSLWSEMREVNQSMTSSGGTVQPPQQSLPPRRRKWIRFLLCGCATPMNNVVAPAV